MSKSYSMKEVREFLNSVEAEVERMVGRPVKVDIFFLPHPDYIDEFNIEQINVTIENIIKKVCEILDESIESVKGPSRIREIVECRYIAIYTIHKIFYPSVSFKKIGEFFNHRDHSTIMSALKTSDDLLKYEKTFVQKFNTCQFEIEKMLNPQKEIKDETI